MKEVNTFVYRRPVCQSYRGANSWSAVIPGGASSPLQSITVQLERHGLESEVLWVNYQHDMKARINAILLTFGPGDPGCIERQGEGEEGWTSIQDFQEVGVVDRSNTVKVTNSSNNSPCTSRLFWSQGDAVPSIYLDSRTLATESCRFH